MVSLRSGIARLKSTTRAEVFPNVINSRDQGEPSGWGISTTALRVNLDLDGNHGGLEELEDQRGA